MNEALFSSKNMCWCTPLPFFKELDDEFHFELDPAATDKSAKCPKYFTPETDGLAESWGGTAYSATLHTVDRSKSGYAKAMKKAGSRGPSLSC